MSEQYYIIIAAILVLATLTFTCILLHKRGKTTSEERPEPNGNGIITDYYRSGKLVKSILTRDDNKKYVLSYYKDGSVKSSKMYDDKNRLVCKDIFYKDIAQLKSRRVKNTLNHTYNYKYKLS